MNLHNKHLIRLLDHFETENGYVAVFKWFDGECLQSQWSFPPPHKYTHPDSPYFRFRKLSIQQRLKSYKNILEFHIYVENKIYVAIDSYDN